MIVAFYADIKGKVGYPRSGFNAGHQIIIQEALVFSAPMLGPGHEKRIQNK